MTLYQVRIELFARQSWRDDLILSDLAKSRLEERVLHPREQGRPITVKGRTLNWDEIKAIKISTTERPAEEVARMIADDRARGGFVSIGGSTPAWQVVNQGTDVTDDLVVGPPGDAADRNPSVQTSTDPEHQRRVMVVIGRDNEANDALFGFLKAIDLKPQEWTQLVAATAEGSPYIGDVLDRAMEIVQAVVVLFTPDDLVHLREELARTAAELNVHGQPRPNVLFEAGLAFGRHPKQTILVEYGELRGLSDLIGRHAVRIDGGPAALRDLAGRLATAGCRVDISGTAWLDAGRFPVRKTGSDSSRASDAEG